MASVVISSRADLDAISGTPEYTAFMAMLSGSLWRLEKDDEAQAWLAVEDDSTIARFGFVRADFPDATPPALPAYTPPVVAAASCSPWQMRKMLNQLGLRQGVEDAVAASTDQAMKDGWGYATEFRSDDPFVIGMGAALGKTAAETRDLILSAAAL